MAGIVRGALERTRGRRSDGDDATSRLLRCRDLLRGGRRDLVRLRIDPVLLDVLGAHRFECAVANVQRERGASDAGGIEKREEAIVEVQAGGRCRDRSADPCVHRLVPLAVVGCVGTMNVRRQRDVTERVHGGVDRRRPVDVEPDQPTPEESLLEDLGS